MTTDSELKADLKAWKAAAIEYADTVIALSDKVPSHHLSTSIDRSIRKARNLMLRKRRRK